MRLLFVALMIALLPLRGWVGDAMAMTPASHAMPASHPGHTPEAHADLADCHGHADMAHAEHSNPDAHDAHAASSDCGSCSACQICHSVAMTPMLPVFAADVLPASAPQSAIRELASAERAPGYKPPIS